MTTVAVLDDYQGRAREYADWASLEPGVEVEFFREPISPDALAVTLAEFDVLVLMRERTAFPRSVLEALPNLRLLVTTGMRSRSLMEWVLRIMANLLRPDELGPAEAAYRAVAAIASLVPEAA